MSDTFDHEGDAWGSMEDYYNDGDGPRWKPLPTCNRCGTKGLHWKQLKSGKWWLYTKEGIAHSCSGESMKK